ncbi:hypothetical protein Xcel_0462 [Xylanimonas cellulosilytica DSM 15894]|uniref:Uncharacterized protein n=1 Tax=Xylanimonas cellulosilytica (strain DSM 15894 / JCM 12276 / CECT 5975 / KCTC 9989 / LMG 20990 / NBRC 107835 / XIL07) TaxID=446471 RepID=D1BVZ8_XYLCX|nr:DUF6114 domain-containing protein [Xylanimonas cellulosilytica]ACZ29501.1 hypothetical protein Xcel_0462 [Xylanimonas cellulosilytica DSM 15894]
MLLRQRFRQWRQGRPFWGASLTILAGLELFVSSRLDLALGGMVLQFGFAGMQTTIIPLVMVLAGVLVMFQPVHHIFYGVITLALSVYSLVAVNLGGMGVGLVLGVAGSIVVVSWMGRDDVAASPAPPPAGPAASNALADDDAVLLFDDGPPRDSSARWSVAATVSVALAASTLGGGTALGGPCILGFILCNLPTPSESPSPTPSDSEGTGSPEPAPPSPSDLPADAGDGLGDGVGDVVGGVVDGVGDVVGGVVDGVGDVVDDVVGGVGEAAGAADGAADGGTDAAADDGGDAASTDTGLTVDVPQDLPLPDDEALPVVLGGNEDVDVYAVPAELKATDLEISGIQAVALVSVPVGPGSGERRNAIKLVADHVRVTGFHLRTYAGANDRHAGTETTADYVTMDGDATMYITSITLDGPDGNPLTIDADAPPPTLTSLVLAAVNPTVGLLGATSDSQVWSGFHERVWAS